MRDTELYRHLLGLEPPWTVANVELKVKEQRVDVWAEHADSPWPCAECGKPLPLYDHAPERCWRHLDSCQFMTYLHARIPRVDCPEHGVRQIRVPWAEPKSRFTILFERLAIEVLKETDVLGAARILRISWDEAWHLIQRAVARGQARKEKRAVRRVGVDEKSAAKGHDYLTIVCDLEEATVEYIADDRKQESLDQYFHQLTPEQREAIEAVGMDMWEPYVRSVSAHLPGAAEKIVFDKFHIIRHLVQAVDRVRRREHRAQAAIGDSRLSGTKYLWLYSEENLPEKHRDRFQSLRAADLKTARAWALKEVLRALWGYWSRGWAARFFARWYFWATHSRLKPMIEVARMLKRHLANVLTYFRHRVTNAVAEGLNSKIQTIKKRAYGFRNREHFKLAIYFHCGGLDLYPSTHVKAG
jgi:transposase